MAQSFNAVGSRTQLAATIGSTADFVNAFTFDNLQRMSRIDRDGQSGGNSVAETRIDLAYNAVSQFSTITRFADLAGTDLVVTSSYAYDGNNRLTSLDHTQGSTALAGYDVTFDNIDRIRAVRGHPSFGIFYDAEVAGVAGATHPSPSLSSFSQIFGSGRWKGPPILQWRSWGQPAVDFCGASYIKGAVWEKKMGVC